MVWLVTKWPNTIWKNVSNPRTSVVRDSSITPLWTHQLILEDRPWLLHLMSIRKRSEETVWPSGAIGQWDHPSSRYSISGDIVKEQPYKLPVVLLQVLQELNQLRIVHPYPQRWAWHSEMPVNVPGSWRAHAEQIIVQIWQSSISTSATPCIWEPAM